MSVKENILVALPLKQMLGCRNRKVQQPFRGELETKLIKEFEFLLRCGIGTTRSAKKLRDIPNFKDLPQIKGFLYCEAEIQFHMQPSACECCSNLKFDEFLRRVALLCNRYQLRVQNPKSLADHMNIPLQQAVELNDTVQIVTRKRAENAELSIPQRKANVRIYFENSGVWYDYKCNLAKSIVYEPTTCYVGKLSVALETKKQRLHNAPPEDVTLLRNCMSRCENAAIAFNRFLHPRDDRISLTYRETTTNDISYVCIEYELTSFYENCDSKFENDTLSFSSSSSTATSATTSTNKVNNKLNWDYVKEIMSLFPHNTWNFAYRNERARVGVAQFNQIYRQKVYTYCPPPTAFVVNTIDNDKSKVTLQILHHSHEYEKDDEAMYAVKWDGSQHVMQFAYRWTVPTVMQIHILPSNRIPGYEAEISVKSESSDTKTMKQANANSVLAKDAYLLNEFFFLVEVVKSKNKSMSHLKETTKTGNITPNCENQQTSPIVVIIVDVSNKLLYKYPFWERQRILQSLFNERLINILNNVCLNKIEFRLQTWYLEKPLLTKCLQDTCDGFLVYVPKTDAVFKMKSVHTVDLSFNAKGIIFTYEGVIVAKTSKTSNNISNAFRYCENRIIEFDVTAKYLKSTSAPSIYLAFSRFRDDRIIANSYVEFCDAVKAVVTASLSK